MQGFVGSGLENRTSIETMTVSSYYNEHKVESSKFNKFKLRYSKLLQQCQSSSVKTY